MQMSDALTGPIGSIPVGAFVPVALAVLAFLGWLFKKFYPTSRRIYRFVDAVLGVEAQGDQPARPGMIARQEKAEQQMEAVQEGLKAVTYELRPNGGESFRDEVVKKMDGHGSDVAELKTAFNAFVGKTEAETREIHQRLERITNDELAEEVKTRMGDDPTPTED